MANFTIQLFEIKQDRRYAQANIVCYCMYNFLRDELQFHGFCHQLVQLNLNLIKHKCIET